MDEFIIGYDVTNSDSEDMSCIVYRCGRCGYVIDVELYSLPKKMKFKEKLKYLKSQEKIIMCENCGLNFSKTIELI